MTFRPAYDIPLVYGGKSTVWLRPSLQAAMRLESLHKGFPELLVKVQQFDTFTIREIITIAATDKDAAKAVLEWMALRPLGTAKATLLTPVLALVSAILTPSTGDTDKNSPHETAKPVAWDEFYADVFKIATGWLGWAPDTAWNATIPDILNAFEGHTDRLKALHGGSEHEASANTQDQREANIAAGLDPEFDRAGLRALKALSHQRVGQAI